MPDNHRRYFAIQKALRRRMPHVKGHAERHLMTLTALICGILGSKQTKLPAIASKTPGPPKRQSRITTLERWLKNKNVALERYYLPCLQDLLHSLPDGPLVLVMDGSQVGKDCMALVVSVLHQKRALPLCWLVGTGKQGHLPQDLHCRLFPQVKALLTDEREVVFLGDGEFDGTDLLTALEQAGWQLVCRTAKNACLYEEGVPFSLGDLLLGPGDLVEIENVAFTQAQYAPVTVVAVWESAYQEPLYLVTNLELG